MDAITDNKNFLGLGIGFLLFYTCLVIGCTGTVLTAIGAGIFAKTEMYVIMACFIVCTCVIVVSGTGIGLGVLWYRNRKNNS